MIPLLFSLGVLSLGCGHVFDGKDVIGASVIAYSSQGQTAHVMSRQSMVMQRAKAYAIHFSKLTWGIDRINVNTGSV